MGYDVAISKDTSERYSRLQARKRKRLDVDTADPVGVDTVDSMVENLTLLVELESGTLCCENIHLPLDSHYSLTTLLYNTHNVSLHVQVLQLKQSMK